MAQLHGIGPLREAILREARERADAEVEQAHLMAAEDRRRAQDESDEERARVLREAQREASAYRRRAASTAETENRVRLLEVRETLIQSVLDRAMLELRRGSGARDRLAESRRLVLEAALQTGGGSLIVLVGRGDAGLLTPGMLEEMRQALAQHGVEACLIPGEPVDIAGGAIVMREGGRMVVDNSFESRLKRQEATLRNEVWRLLRDRA